MTIDHEELERLAREMCERVRGAGAWDRPKCHRRRNVISIDVLRDAFLVREDGALVRRKSITFGKNRERGNVVGSMTKNGYLVTTIKGHGYLVHRIIYAMHYGNWPRFDVDHIDGNRTNNRPENLRDVPPFINSQNLHKARSSNTNGRLGVTGSPNKWRAEIRINGRKVSLGTFENKQDAANAYLEKKRVVHAGCTI